MRRLPIVAFVLIAAALSVATAPVLAGLSVEELKQRVQDRSTRIKEFRALLNDPDQNVRLAALDEMTRSDDPVMREVAFEAGFRSADQAMRALALRAKLQELSVIVLRLSEPEGASEETKKFLEKYPNIDVSIREFDDKSSTLKLRKGGYGGTGQISGEQFELQGWNCRGMFELADGARLKGLYDCPQPDPIPAVIELM